MSKKNDARKDDVPQEQTDELDTDFESVNQISDDEVASVDDAKAVPQTDADKVVELTDLLKRKQAEFVNYQNRMETMQKEHEKLASVKVMQKLVPIVELFDMAVAHKDKKDDFIAGMEMVHKQFHEVLSSEGVVVESLLNKPFDPTKAQAMSTVERNDVAENTVVTEYQKCFRIGTRVLRHAKVVVSKKP
jgi:molecular chaperone GrpE